MRVLQLFTIYTVFLVTPEIIYSQPNPLEQQCTFSGINYIEAIAFEKSLRFAIKHNDPKQLAKLVQYPLTIYIPKKIAKPTNTYTNKKVIIKTKQQLIQQYSKIITPDLKAKLLKQAAGNIFCNWQGAMIYDGSFWFKGTPLRIFVINQPEPS